ncbi:hypothetical protein J6590_043586 [Homalodisca vitripennis]|nr:hypothetical protein J6590_043586 [Homalodisca vitripennis]
MSDECIAAQSFVFLTGGSEATANAIAFILYELAVNPHVQTKLQQEVDSVLGKYEGKLTYQSLKEMTYLDQIIQETNRKYSFARFLRRISNAPYQIPGTDIVLEEGTKITIPLYAIHNDPANYPEPDKFIPERFEGNNHRTNSNKYLPFGDGPRVCIAMRFVILELKACLAIVMSKYTTMLDPRTEVPLRFNARSIAITPCGGIWTAPCPSKFKLHTSVTVRARCGHDGLVSERTCLNLQVGYCAAILSLHDGQQSVDSRVGHVWPGNPLYSNYQLTLVLRVLIGLLWKIGCSNKNSRTTS